MSQPHAIPTRGPELVPVDPAALTEAADGAFAGYTELVWNPENPRFAQQGDTAVAPEHRGHGLGKWLKAGMLERLHRERPDVRVVRTGNADTNAAMLGINEALAFAATRAVVLWQVDADELARRLEPSAAP